MIEMGAVVLYEEPIVICGNRPLLKSRALSLCADGPSDRLSSGAVLRDCSSVVLRL